MKKLQDEKCNSEINLPSLEQVHSDYQWLTRYLIEQKLSVTTMESCTSGFIASLITDTEGSSAVIKGSCVTYSNEAKIKNGVDGRIIDEFGVYSTQTAEAMAKAVLEIYSSTVGIGVTGTFGNVDPNNKDSVPGNVYFAILINSPKNPKLITKNITLPKNISRFQSKICVASEVVKVLKEVL